MLANINIYYKLYLIHIIILTGHIITYLLYNTGRRAKLQRRIRGRGGCREKSQHSNRCSPWMEEECKADRRGVPRR